MLARRANLWWNFAFCWRYLIRLDRHTDTIIITSSNLPCHSHFTTNSKSLQVTKHSLPFIALHTIYVLPSQVPISTPGREATVFTRKHWTQSRRLPSWITYKERMISYIIAKRNVSAPGKTKHTRNTLKKLLFPIFARLRQVVTHIE